MFGQPDRQAGFCQFAGASELVDVPGDVRIALGIQWRRTESKSQFASVTSNRFIEHEMQLLTMRTFIVEEQRDDIGGVGRTEQRHGMGINGGQA